MKTFSYLFFSQKIVVETVVEHCVYMGSSAPVEGMEGEAFFFSHNSSIPIPIPSTLSEANSLLPEYLEFGLVDNTAIFNLEDSLMQV